MNWSGVVLASIASATCWPDRDTTDAWQKLSEGRKHFLRAKRHTPTVAELLRPQVLPWPSASFFPALNLSSVIQGAQPYSSEQIKAAGGQVVSRRH